MDVVTSANGNANQDIRCYASGKGQQKDWHQVYVADVLVHRQGCQWDRRVFLPPRERAIVPLRQAGHQHCRAERKGWRYLGELR